MFCHKTLLGKVSFLIDWHCVTGWLVCEPDNAFLFELLMYLCTRYLKMIHSNLSRQLNEVFIANMVLSTDDAPSPPSAAYMRQWTGSALIQIMACRLFGANSDDYINQCWDIVNWTLRNKLRWNFHQNTKFPSRKCIWKYRLRNGGHFVPGEVKPSIWRASVCVLGPSWFKSFSCYYMMYGWNPCRLWPIVSSHVVIANN